MILLGISLALLVILIVFDAWIRCHLFGFCPRCNSDAPAMCGCPVCGGRRWSDIDITQPNEIVGRPSWDLRRLWWHRHRTIPPTSDP